MLLSGFTFIRNALKYDFPIQECIESMLPLVDELVVNVGKSEDETEKLLQSLAAQHSKIRLLHSVWDDKKTESGLVLSEQTNIALAACKGRWALYLQADEAIHEADFSTIRQAIEKEELSQLPVDGFRFRYLHFYGGYTLVQRPWNWYPSEIRIVRTGASAKSFGDAQTFRAKDGARLNTKLLDAHVYHYGHAREPEKMANKIRYFHRFWHGDNHKIAVQSAYQLNFKNLVWFWGAHPASYQRRVEQGQSWSPKPEKLFSDKIKKIYFIGGQAHLQKVEALKLALKGKGVDFIECASLFSAIRALRQVKEKSALIDFAAEERGILHWIGLRLLSHVWRVAVSTNGRLSKSLISSYDAVMWGGHEKSDEGFVLPKAHYTNQILAWLGIAQH